MELQTALLEAQKRLREIRTQHKINFLRQRRTPRRMPARLRQGGIDFTVRIQLVALEHAGWLLENAVAADALSLNADPINVIGYIEELLESEQQQEAQLFVFDLFNPHRNHP